MKYSIKHIHASNGYIFFIPPLSNLSAELEKTIAGQRQAIQVQQNCIDDMEKYINNARTLVEQDIERNKKEIAALQLALEEIEKKITDSENKVCESFELGEKNKYIADMCADKSKAADELERKKVRHGTLELELVSIDKNIAHHKGNLPQAKSRLARLQLRLSESLIESINSRGIAPPSI